MAKAGRADFDLIVGANKTLSYSQLVQDIDDVVNRINKNPKKIKLKFDISGNNNGKGGSGGRGGGGNSPNNDDVKRMNELIKGYTQLTQMYRDRDKFSLTGNVELEKQINLVRDLISQFERSKIAVDDYAKGILQAKESVAKLTAEAAKSPTYNQATLQKRGETLIATMRKDIGKWEQADDKELNDLIHKVYNLNKSFDPAKANQYKDSLAQLGLEYARLKNRAVELNKVPVYDQAALQTRGENMLTKLRSYLGKWEQSSDVELQNLITKVEGVNKNFNPDKPDEYKQQISQLALEFAQLRNRAVELNDELDNNKARIQGYTLLNQMLKSSGKYTDTDNANLDDQIEKVRTLNGQFEQGAINLDDYQKGLVEAREAFAKFNTEATKVPVYDESALRARGESLLSQMTSSVGKWNVSDNNALLGLINQVKDLNQNFDPSNPKAYDDALDDLSFRFLQLKNSVADTDTELQRNKDLTSGYRQLRSMEGNLGKWDDSSNKRLADLIEKLKTLNRQYEESSGKYGPEYRKQLAGIAKEYNEIAAEAEDATGPVKSLNELLKWTTVVKTFRAAYNTIKKMAQVSIELDQAFTQLRIVTGATDTQMRKFTDTTVTLAKELGQSVSGVASSIETFSRLGYTLEEAASLSKYAQILANVAGTDIGSATTGLTSIIKGFGFDVDQAEHVADVLVEVGRKYAVSASEMMTAYEKSGAALNATNTSFEKSAGLIAAANASVQNASTVGTALKTVSARIRGSKAELEELDEDMEDLAEGFSKYAEEIKGITGFDIMVEGTTDQFKDLYEIFDGLSEHWVDLSDTLKSRVSEILGGTRQLQVISSIIGNWKDAAGAYEDAMNAVGVATAANDVYMESAQAHLNQLKATYEELAMTIADSEMIKQVIDLGTAFLNAANAFAKFQNSIGGIRTLLISMVGLVASLKAPDIAKGLSSIIGGFKNLKSVLTGVKLTGEAASTALSAGIGAVSFVLTIASAAYGVWKHNQEEQKRKMEEAAEAYKEATEEAESYKKRIDELQTVLKDETTSLEDANAARDELLGIQDKLIDKYGAEAKSIDLVGDSASRSADKIDQLTNSLGAYNFAQYKDQWQESVKQMEMKRTSGYSYGAIDLYGIGSEDERWKRNSFNMRLYQYLNQLSGVYGGISVGDNDQGGLTLNVNGSAEQVKSALSAVVSGLEDFKHDLIGFDREDMAEVDRFIDALRGSLTGEINILDNIISEHASSRDAYYDGLIASVSEYSDAYKDVQETMKAYNDMLSQSYSSESERTEAVQQYNEALDATKEKIENLNYAAGDEGLKDWFLGMLQEAPEETTLQVLSRAAEAIEEVKTATGKLDFEALGKFKDAVSSLGEAWNDMFGEEGEQKLFSALETIHDKFSDVDGIDEYINRLVSARDNSKEFSKILDELITVKVLDRTESELLAGTEEDLIAAMLREAGIANDDEAALDILTVAKERLRLKNIDTIDGLSAFINGLADEAAYSDVARAALIRLAAQQVITNNTKMSFEDQISNLATLARAAGVAGDALRYVTLGKNGKNYIGVGKLIRDYGEDYEQTAGSAVLNSIQSEIDKQLQNIHFDYTPKVTTTTQKDTTTKDTTKDLEEQTKVVDEYTASIDKYREAIKRLNDVQQVRGKVDETIAHSDDLKAQILMQKELISLYSQEQQALHALNDLRDKDIEEGAQKLRELGFAVQYNADTNELWIENLEHLNELVAEDSGSYETIEEATNAYRKETEELVNSIADLNEKNKESSQSWWDLKYSIEDADEQIQQLLKDIVKQASEGVDAIQSVYDTLHSAADEYAQTGYISVDTLQSVIGLGVEYMAYLRDENGQLVINEERIRDVIKAKTEQLAIESSLSYIEALRIAQERGNTEELNRLLYATESATDATWGLVYASLGLLDLDGEQYQAALNNINAIRAMAESAIMGLDDMSHSVVDELNRMKSGVDDILKYVMDMLKQKIQDQVDALNGMKTAYSDIIQKQKESLKNAKSEANTQKEMAKRLKEIAKIQAQVDALSLDTSRESQAKRASLLEELSSLQEDLADKQTDYMIEKNDEALDKMDKAYSEQKDREIETLQDSISSYQKLYDMAIDYIRENWDTLYDELMEWNSEYGLKLARRYREVPRKITLICWNILKPCTVA